MDTEGDNVEKAKATIASMKQNLDGIYDSIEEKGGTIPEDKNLANLPAAILTIGA